MSKKSKQAKLKRTLKLLKVQAQLERAEFFANGGTLAEWRGISNTHRDRKKHQLKYSCRGNRWRK